MSHKPRKRFGQNFLTDQQVIQRIVDVINPREDDRLIEIGPGQAALTLPLLESGAQLTVVEIDRDLADLLRQRLGHHENFRLAQADALRADFGELSENAPFRLIGNLPYNISTPLIFHLLQWSHLIRDMHFMLQREVVRRMAAAPGGKAWGRLSVMCQYHCTVTELFTVPPEAFSPPPKVQSAIVRLVPHASPPVEINDLDAFDRLLQQCFSMRRKTLRNCLKGLLDSGQIERAGIDPGARPETLGLEQFAALARNLD
jgi:16S rRNA (adenine1518-N6/adenine1519-N6)-dimethyltransferase